MSRVTTAWYKLFGLILVVAAVLKAWDPAAGAWRRNSSMGWRWVGMSR